jgi:hypothetical protein
VSIRNHVLVTIQVEVKLELLKKRQVICNDVLEVRVPFSPHRVVESSCLPNDAVVVGPLNHCFVDPLKLFVALFLNTRVVANNVSKPVLRGTE